MSEAILVKSEDTPVIINPFVDVKMYQPPSSSETLAEEAIGGHRKLSSVSDIRDSIRETHEEANHFSSKTIPRSFQPRKQPRRRPLNYFQDGTESVKSFVIVSNSTLNLTESEDEGEEWSESDVDFVETLPNNSNKRSLINKCVTKVKSFVNNK